MAQQAKVFDESQAALAKVAAANTAKTAFLKCMIKYLMLWTKCFNCFWDSVGTGLSTKSGNFR